MDHSTQLEGITENDILFVATFSKEKGIVHIFSQKMIPLYLNTTSDLRFCSKSWLLYFSETKGRCHCSV